MKNGLAILPFSMCQQISLSPPLLNQTEFLEKEIESNKSLRTEVLSHILRSASFFNFFQKVKFFSTLGIYIQGSNT